MKRRWLAGGVALYLLFMVVAFPVDDYLPVLMPKGVTLTDIDGNAFYGNSEVAFVNGEKGAVSWTLKPLSVLLLHPAYTVHYERSGIKVIGRVELSPFAQSITLTNVDGRVDVENAFPELPIDSLHIPFNIELTSFSQPAFDCDRASGRLRIKRIDAPELELGEIPEQNGKIKCSDKGVHINIPLKHSALKGDLIGVITKQAFTLRIKVASTDQSSKKVLPILLGPPRPNGYFYGEFSQLFK